MIQTKPSYLVHYILGVDRVIKNFNLILTWALEMYYSFKFETWTWLIIALETTGANI